MFCIHISFLESQLTIDDLLKVYTALLEAKNKWYFIGLCLKISSSELGCIRTQCSDNSERLCKVLEEWLHQSDERTWSTLRSALEHKSVNLKDVAEKLRT